MDVTIVEKGISHSLFLELKNGKKQKQIDNTLNIKEHVNLEKKKKYNIQLSIIIKWLNEQEPKYLCYLLNNYQSINN